MNRLVLLTICTALFAGCTSTPDRYKPQKSQPQSAVLPVAQLPFEGQNRKLTAIANAEIGVPDRYIDPQSGMTVELVVNSEYFSANGRYCRRFIEVINAENHNGVSCQDAQSGWTELPLADYLR